MIKLIGAPTLKFRRRFSQTEARRSPPLYSTSPSPSYSTRTMLLRPKGPSSATAPILFVTMSLTHLCTTKPFTGPRVKPVVLRYLMILSPGSSGVVSRRRRGSWHENRVPATLKRANYGRLHANTDIVSPTYLSCTAAISPIGVESYFLKCSAISAQKDNVVPEYANSRGPPQLEAVVVR
jgi:hypothetical protein